MARKLYLHIGNHKTGSTSIQLALARSQDPRVFNVLNEDVKGNRLNSWFGNSWVIGRQDPKLYSAEFDPKLAGVLAEHNAQGDVIFSSEDLSWIFTAEALRDFANTINSEFDQVHVIAHLRRQDRNMVSFYQQGLSSKHSRIKAFTGIAAHSLPEYQPHFDAYFDYNHRLGLWADVFGNQALKIRVFKDLLNRGNIVDAFAEDVELTDLPKHIHARKSRTKTEQLLSLRLAELDLPFELPKDLTKYLIKGAKSSPPRQRAEEFYDHFRESNISLNLRFKINDREAVFDEDFSEYSEEGDEDWDIESAKQAIDYLLFAHAQAHEKHRHSDQMRQKLRRQVKRLERANDRLAKNDGKS